MKIYESCVYMVTYHDVLITPGLPLPLLQGPNAAQTTGVSDGPEPMDGVVDEPQETWF